MLIWRPKNNWNLREDYKGLDNAILILWENRFSFTEWIPETKKQTTWNHMRKYGEGGCMPPISGGTELSKSLWDDPFCHYPRWGSEEDQGGSGRCPLVLGSPSVLHISFKSKLTQPASSCDRTVGSDLQDFFLKITRKHTRE